MTPDQFRELGHRMVDWIAAYRENLESRPVMSRAQPGEIARQFPSAPLQQGVGFDGVLDDFERLVLPGITHWNHPGFFAYFPSNMPLSGVVAELAIAGLGAQCMSWQTSPAATELEDVVMEWLRQMLALPPEFIGVIQDTASTATLTALLCARERATDYSQNRGGLQSESHPLIVYASTEAHSSVEKAALLAGLGRKNIRLIPTDAEYAMRPGLLEAAIEEDVRARCVPCAIVATSGTTASVALDPVARIAEIAQQSGAWLHIDAAMAGVAMILPECRWMWAGAEHADSIVLNPHKWLGPGCDFSAYYVRDPQHLIRVMSTNPSYLRTAQDSRVRNLRDWGIPLGRRFRALKMWFLLRDQGVAGLQGRLRRDIENAQWLKSTVDAAPEWERVAPVHLQTVCLRHVPAELAGSHARGSGSVSTGTVDHTADDARREAALAAHNLRIADDVNRAGRAYVTPSLLAGRQIIRVSIGAEPTERRHVEMVWAELQRAAGVV
jgi:aromatic-L-amino-acid decarboxylase